MLTIWGRANSINVQKVLCCCDEIGVAYERIDAGMQFGVVNTEPFLSLNPNGFIPTLVDGEMVLWESHAIMRYLTRRYDVEHSITPEDEAAIAQADKWLDWVHTVAWPAMKPVFWGLVRTPQDKRNHAEIEAGIAACSKAFSLVDQVLSHQAYLGGDHFTFGDIPMALIAHRWFSMPIENRPALPHLKHWYEGIVVRPGFARHGALPLS